MSVRLPETNTPSSYKLFLFSPSWNLLQFTMHSFGNSWTPYQYLKRATRSFSSLAILEYCSHFSENKCVLSTLPLQVFLRRSLILSHSYFCETVLCSAIHQCQEASHFRTQCTCRYSPSVSLEKTQETSGFFFTFLHFNSWCEDFLLRRVTHLEHWLLNEAWFSWKKRSDFELCRTPLLQCSSYFIKIKRWSWHAIWLLNKQTQTSHFVRNADIILMIAHKNKHHRSVYFIQ